MSALGEFQSNVKIGTEIMAVFSNLAEIDPLNLSTSGVAKIMMDTVVLNHVQAAVCFLLFFSKTAHFLCTL